MKFSYSGRTMHDKSVQGVIDAPNRKGAIMQLKKQKIIVIKIEEYKEKKDLFQIFKKFNSKTENNKSSTNSLSNKISEKLPFLNKKDKIKSENSSNSDIDTGITNTDEKTKYSFNDINSILHRNDLFEKIKYEPTKATNKELEEIDVDAVINSDFKDGLSTFKKEKEKRKSLLTAEFDLEKFKKVLNTDIGKGKKSVDGVKRKKGKKVKSKELLMFCKKLSTLLETGVTITRSMQILMGQTTSLFFQKILAVVTTDIANGVPLSQSMSRFPNVFTPHFTALVKTGEDTGELAKTFNLLYEEILNSTKLKSKVKGAAMYPGVILSVLLVAFIVAAKILVPMFTDLFEGMGLPKFTKVVFNFLTFFDKNLLWLVLGGILIFFLLKLSLRNISIRYRFDALKLSLPTVGIVLTEYHIINILRTIDISLKNGLPMTDALELAIQTTDNIALKFELQKVLNKVIQGISLSTAMNESPIFPSLCIQMLKIGEESGRMEDLIIKTLEFYEWELNDFIDKTSKLIEPIAIILVAAFVVPFVFAVAIPMFDLSSGSMIN